MDDKDKFIIRVCLFVAVAFAVILFKHLRRNRPEVLRRELAEIEGRISHTQRELGLLEKNLTSPIGVEAQSVLAWHRQEIEDMKKDRAEILKELRLPVSPI